jgi:hypothetical protein
MADVISRERISLEACAASAWWAANPAEPAPPNPYCCTAQPEHYAVWRAAFERWLIAATADTEASA